MFTHVDHNNRPKMVDVGGKVASHRFAWARSVVVAPECVMKHFNNNEICTKKGPVFQTAIIAGTMAVKKTHDLIPFCHPMAIEGCEIEICVSDLKIIVDCKVSVFHKTGVEMEALFGASVAALTIYDMCKALSHEISIEQTELMEKSGGKHDYQKS